MAIYQIPLYFIPRKACTERFGNIPERIETPYVSADGIELQEWPFEVPASFIAEHIDQWQEWRHDTGKTWISWKSAHSEIDHDIYIAFQEGDGYITEFSFRADLREPDLTFLRAMVELARQYGWLLADYQGRVATPDAIVDLIRKSDAFRFVSNPRKFLDDLAG